LLLSTIYGKELSVFAKSASGRNGSRTWISTKMKSGTPTMGGLIIIFATLVPVVLFAKLQNIYSAFDHVTLCGWGQ
jgi:phospho-N-acetylmuramoyl-pentapeptide-transferase